MELDNEKRAWLVLLSKVGQQPLHEDVRASLIKDIDGADTASDLAGYVAQHLHALYKVYGQDCLDLILHGLSPTVWKEAGILVNPMSIKEQWRHGVNVVADGSVTTEQWQKGVVTYYGDVRLNILSGTAHVVDTKYPIQADGDAIVLAYGGGFVNAAGSCRVWLHDRTRCEASGDVGVQAFDRSYVQAVVGRPTISAHDEAQFLVRTPRAAVHMEGNARGVILCEETVPQPMKVQVAGSGLLYIDSQSHVDVQIKSGDFRGVILQRSQVRMSSDEICKLLIPRHSAATMRYAAPLQAPMNIEQLKLDLQPFLPDELTSSGYRLFAQSKNEQEVGEFVQRHLTEMAAYGLGGDFLRSHFTQATLEALHIHTGSGAAVPDIETMKLAEHFFFGDQLVFADRYNGSVLGFDQTLVIANSEGHPSYTYHFANAVTWGDSMLFAHNNGQVLGMDHSKVYAYHGTKAVVQHGCSCDAYDHARVMAYDNAIVLGYHKSQLLLNDQCYAEVNDQCQAFVDNCQQVVVRNEGAISYYDDGHIASEQLDIKSDQAKVHAYPELSSYVQAKELAGLDKGVGHNRTIRR